MKNRLSKTAFLLFCLMICLVFASVFFASADSVYTRPRKSVYLVLDDSGSMSGSSENDANYALQTFLATMDKDDEVHVYFLNNKNAVGSVDISQKDDILLENVRNKYPIATGGTPFYTVTEAAKDLQAAAKKTPDRDYWLVVVGDGGFDSSIDYKSFLDKFSMTELNENQYPNFLYLGIGGYSSDIIAPAGAENRFFVEDYADIITAMNQATLDITNRQRIMPSSSGQDTIEFDIDYPVRNIIILAQNKQTKIVNADCVSQLNLGENYNVKYPVINPGLQYTTVCYLTEKNGSSIKSGHFKFTFDAPITKDNVIILCEPAIGIAAKYIGENGVEVDPANMMMGQTFTVEMTVCDSETGDPIDGSVLNGIQQSIIVNGTEYQGATVDVPINDPDIDVDLIAVFPDGFTLDLHNRYTDLEEIILLDIDVSNSGRMEGEITDMRNASTVTVTPTKNSRAMTDEEFQTAKLTVKGTNVFVNRFRIERDEDNNRFILHPKAGLFWVFTGRDNEYEIVLSDGNGNSVNGQISVQITGSLPWVKIITAFVVVVVAVYLLICELTRIRFPIGSYIEYYNTLEDGQLSGRVGSRIMLNRITKEKLLNGSYLPIPRRRYKVKGTRGCEDIVFVPDPGSRSQRIGVEGVVCDEDGDASYIQRDCFSEPIANHINMVGPVAVKLKPGNFLEKADGDDIDRYVRYSTKKWNREHR